MNRSPRKEGPDGRQPAEAQRIEIGAQMQDQTTAPAGVEQEPTLASVGRAQWRVQCRELALQSALQKRAAGVPTYTVAEAAALLSVSQEHLYRLVRAGAFPSVALRMGGHGRYVVPAQAVDNLLAAAAESGGCVDVQEFAEAWQASRSGGAR
jgi:excisionase family DNA binding protein